MWNTKLLLRLLLTVGLMAGMAGAAHASTPDGFGAPAGDADSGQDGAQTALVPDSGAHVVAGKGGNGGGKGGGGNGGGGNGGATGPRVAFAAAVDGWQIFTVNPDGSGSAQLTTSADGMNQAMAWSADNHILVDNDGWLRVLSVTDPADPNTVTEVHRWQTQTPWQGHADLSQHVDGGVLPLANQLVAVIEGDAEHNLVAYAPDGTARLPLTSYVSTYVPGGSGVEYEVRDLAWLPDSADGSRIRLWYTLLERQWLNGSVQSTDITHRVLTLSTAGWPAITTAGSVDNTLVGGADVSAALFFSRDGTKVAYASPGGYDVLVANVTYDDSTDTVTVDASGATTVMDSAANGVRASSGGMSFSPDNSQLAFQGQDVGGRKVGPGSVFAIDVAAGAAPEDIDGQRRTASVGPVWGP